MVFFLIFLGSYRLQQKVTALSFMIVFLMVDPGPIRFEPAPNQCSMILFLGHVL